jgi:hypothetical protein
MEWFREDQAFSPSYDLAPPPLSRTSLACKTFSGDTQEDQERETVELWGKTNHATTKSVVLYKSFHTLCLFVRKDAIMFPPLGKNIYLLM